MALEIPDAWRSGRNSRVLAHLETASAHSDLATELIAAVKPLGDVQIFCPDWAQCRYVVVSTNDLIFGFAMGLETIAFRLEARMKSRALTTGAAAYSAAGDDWGSFILFRHDWPKVDLQFWALKAYAYAREHRVGG
ncbi:MAG: hypothetical protein EXS32_11475 [Opitutus sp.]|nr:hypothetical protein [Opitutus sp.]